MVPAVDALAAAISDAQEARLTVVELDAVQQPLAIGLGQLTQRAHRVLALDAVARMHEAVGDVPGGGEDQQAFRVEVGRPTATHLPVFMRGRLSNTVGRPSGSD